jgi:N-acetylglutamate synthase-like GNAT family acetyltransferase
MKQYYIRIGDKNDSLEEIIDFVAKIFGPNYYDAKRIQESIIKHEPSTMPQNFVIARSFQNELIGLTRIVERKIRVGTAILNCGGISSVGIHPNWRGKGIMHEIMNAAHNRMTECGMDMSFLYGRRVMDGYYTQFGYYGINRYLDLEIISSVADEDKLKVLPFRKENISTIATLYNNSYLSLSGSVVRDEKIWAFLIARMNETDKPTRLLECYANESIEVIGYLVISGNKLIELALADVYFPYLPNVIKKLGLNYISIHPYHPFYAYVRSNFSTIQHERFTLDGGYMGKILNPSSVLSKIYSDIFLRASNVGATDKKVRIFEYEIELSSGNISKAAGPDDIILKRNEDSIRFLLGMHRLEDYSGVYLNPDKPWLRYIFPPTGFHTSAFDEI